MKVSFLVRSEFLGAGSVSKKIIDVVKMCDKPHVSSFASAQSFKFCN